MKKKLFPMLLLPLLLAAEDFEAYPDAAALLRAIPRRSRSDSAH